MYTVRSTAKISEHADGVVWRCVEAPCCSRAHAYPAVRDFLDVRVRQNGSNRYGQEGDVGRAVPLMYLCEGIRQPLTV